MYAATPFVSGHATATLIYACIWIFGTRVHIKKGIVAVPFNTKSTLLTAEMVVIKIVHDLFQQPVIWSQPNMQTTQNKKETLSADENMRELANQRLGQPEDPSLRDLLTGRPNRSAF